MAYVSFVAAVVTLVLNINNNVNANNNNNNRCRVSDATPIHRLMFTLLFSG